VYVLADGMSVVLDMEWWFAVLEPDTLVVSRQFHYSNSSNNLVKAVNTQGDAILMLSDGTALHAVHAELQHQHQRHHAHAPVQRRSPWRVLLD